MLPDTQFYACAYPEIFQAQTDWIAEHAESLGIGIALHSGDIVDNGSREQWAAAAHALHRLDGRLPYLLTLGNHDADASRTSLVDEHFAPGDLVGQCATFGFKGISSIVNAYAIVELHGTPWLFLGLEFAPRYATLAWASDVLREHPELPAVVVTHAYLYSDGDRYDRDAQPSQPYHPDSYAITSAEGSADGQDIWETLVEPHDHVKLVLSAHVIPDGVARSASRRRSGSVVHEVLTNFQHCERCPCEPVQGGTGYLRTFELDAEQTRLHVRTYSPYLDRFLEGDEYEFDLPL